MTGTAATEDIAKLIDHTWLKPDAEARTIETLCAEAHEHDFHAVCVYGGWVPLARHHPASLGRRRALKAPHD